MPGPCGEIRKGDPVSSFMFMRCRQRILPHLSDNIHDSGFRRRCRTYLRSHPFTFSSSLFFLTAWPGFSLSFSLSFSHSILPGLSLLSSHHAFFTPLPYLFTLHPSYSPSSLLSCLLPSPLSCPLLSAISRHPLLSGSFSLGTRAFRVYFVVVFFVAARFVAGFLVAFFSAAGSSFTAFFVVVRFAVFLAGSAGLRVSI